MPSIVNWSVDVAVGGGPAFAASNSFLAEAYSVVEVAAGAGESTTEPFQAGTIDQLSVLLITSNRYASADLSITLGGETLTLDQPQLYTGAGMLSRFAADVSEITVTNDLADPVTVTVLVGRATS